jgi:hypothetical protein
MRPAELEKLVVERTDASRRGACYSVIAKRCQQTEEHVVAIGGLEGQITLGPSGVGGLVRFTPNAATIPAGPSFAPVAVRAFAYTDERFGTGLGPLQAATDLHQPPRRQPPRR